MFAQVVLARASKHLDKIYPYSLSPELKEKASAGSQVLVPFGATEEIGYIIGFTEDPGIDTAKIKEIKARLSEKPLFTQKSVDLARWLADYYQSFFISALRLIMPPGTKSQEGKTTKRKSPLPVPALPAGRRQAGKRSGLPRTASEIEPSRGRPFVLSAAQQTAVDRVKAAINSQKSEKFLIFGVTGSGKTEVYLQAIAAVLEKGRGAIALVPEISLTPQLIQRFEARFGDQVALLHSGLTLKRRREEWERIAQGAAPIVLGTRSALFAPLKNVGLIVLDEEYENTYKQDKNPRYHSRQVAEHLGQQHPCPVIFGSATPSLESYYKTQTGEYQLLSLPQRIDNRPLPPVEILDLKTESGWLLSHKLRDEIKATLEKGEKVILYMNRRGFFTSAFCRQCGAAVQCPHCSVSMLYHAAEKLLRCSHCGNESPAILICPNCQSAAIGYFGTGTQRIENEVAQAHPEARIIRLDSDTREASKQLKVFSSGPANVLIGTQMISKGLDIPEVTLIGVVNADTALNLPDFRAAERTFQQLTQVAGRAGRRHLPGKVMIQTFNPEHYAVRHAIKHDYAGFYNEEAKIRQSLGYPPFGHLILVTFQSLDDKKAAQTAEDLKRLFVEGSFVLLGPARAPIEKLRGEYRYHLLLKGKEQAPLRQGLEEALKKMILLAGVRMSIDVDPMNML